MISRRLIRIKVLQTFYSSLKGDKTLNSAEKELMFSIEKVEELYHYILLLVLDIVHYANNKIEAAKDKKMPSFEDLHPNTKFIDNLVVKQISEDAGLKKYILEKKISWADYPELIKNLYKSVTLSDYFNVYMDDKSRDFNSDKKLIENILINNIAGMDLLEQWMEEKSVFWNDDLDFVLTILVKNIKKLKASDSSLPIVGEFKDSDDREFAVRLIRKSHLHYDEYKQIVEKYTTNWDVDRIAFIDILLMVIAIAEIIEFSNIPVKVTLNEYIEISKTYSTRNSSNFINGILDKIVKVFREEKKFVKEGRGLVGEE
ncbi:MAG: transcription antitermination factor NusB [Bacteroidales bacterium]|nr:transcription antitermination factor NusB [Bacteroidales bacterium]